MTQPRRDDLRAAMRALSRSGGPGSDGSGPPGAERVLHAVRAAGEQRLADLVHAVALTLVTDPTPNDRADPTPRRQLATLADEARHLARRIPRLPEQIARLPRTHPSPATLDAALCATLDVLVLLEGRSPRVLALISHRDALRAP